ncbi:M48 family metalloprotease [Thiohalomonas denitrificans]|uniref:Putative Zn-dependent protease n=1 Tax=Thiohalomonas denitrificans TaxID=415747 RepID=A0A1G5QY38_9GAMM|nr:M48 family metalloprotease [Thiohalomonas denitrificans]SCZ66171.1 Putative Zn-dependent protease [Thiohalomonas denitrificans]
MSLFRRLAAVIGMAVVAATAGCAVNPVSGQSELSLLSEQQEITIGRQEHPKIIEAYGAYDDPELQAYVQRIGERLAARSHRSDLIYRFTVLDSSEVNAFALPGGYIYITRGLLAYLNSEDELAAVLGHEIGHVTARHSVRQISASTAANLGFTLGALLVPELQNRGVSDLFSTLSTALLRGYGREHELEADRLGAQYLAGTGRDPEAMLDVVGVLKNQEQFEIQLAKEENREPRVYHGVFATHPDNDERLKTVVRQAEALPGGQATAPRGPFLRRLDGLVFGESASEGTLRGNAFYHRDLDIALQFPEGWRVENRPDRLVAISPDRSAALQVTVADRNKRISPERFLRDRLKLDDLQGGEPLRVDGLDGYTGVASAGAGADVRNARVAVLYKGSQAFVFLGTPQKADGLKAHDDAMMRSIRTFHALSEEERDLAEPLRLAIIEARDGTTFRELAAESRIHHHAEEQLRLLNARYPRGEPIPGERLKTVQ